MLQENYSDIGSAPDQRYFSLAWSSYLSRNYIISEEGTFGILDHATQITYDFPHVIDELCGIYIHVCFVIMVLWCHAVATYYVRIFRECRFLHKS